VDFAIGTCRHWKSWGNATSGAFTVPLESYGTCELGTSRNGRTPRQSGTIDTAFPPDYLTTKWL